MVERAAEPNFRSRVTLSESPQTVGREADRRRRNGAHGCPAALVERVLVFAERNSRSRRSKSA
jgi:hypothetical protein